MSAEIDNLVLEHLRVLRGAVERIEQKLGDLTLRIASSENQIGQLHKGIALMHEDFAQVQTRIDRVDTRLDRIERRLELRESA
jgi:chromosome segregation ATPase